MPEPKTSTLDYTAANRQAWNETEKKHRLSQYEELLQKFSKPGYSYLGELETKIFEQLGLQGKSVVQLACNNGRETLSIKNLGAARCTGFDISDKFIAQGHEFAKAGNITDCELVASDVYQIPESYNNQYDIAFVSVGALMLMPDLQQFFSIVKRLLNTTGQVFIYERHPLLDMFSWDDKNDPPALVNSYFDTEPKRFQQSLDYWTKETFECSPMYLFHHKLSDVFSGLLSNNFEIQSFEEYEHDISEMYVAFEKCKIKPPLCYTLIAQQK